MTNLSIPESAPIPNDNPSIHDLVVKDLQDRYYLGLIKDILDRKEFGLQKYGTILQADNSRNPLIEAFQESLDQVCYLKQAREQNDSNSLRSLYFRTIDLAEDLKDLISKQLQLGDK